MTRESPWLTMWFAPRATVRRLIAAETPPSWVPVIALAALHQAFSWLQNNAGFTQASDAISAMVTALLFGSASLVYGVLIGPFLLAIVGDWLGGNADASDIRKAVAWSYVPIAVLSVVWIPLIAAFGWRAFGRDLSPHNAAQFVALPLLLLIPIGALWTFVIQVGALAEAQRFSILRSIACLVILAIPFLFLTALVR